NFTTGLSSPLGGLRMKSFRSLPAQKLSPAPFSTMTLISGSLPALLMASPSASYISRLSAFFLSGRFMFMVMMPSLTEVFTRADMCMSPFQGEFFFAYRDVLSDLQGGGKPNGEPVKTPDIARG